MIRISLELAVTIYLGLGLLVLIFWFLVEASRKKTVLPRNTLWQCPVCFFFYVDSVSESLSRCPRCQTLHKREGKEVEYI
ncbi:MAG: hypothetical protein NC911_07140 [Candidatus Omnitrophica bacterium]|nr:hypothetical protein [Candidatus Omnitrophota bacterium]